MRLTRIVLIATFVVAMSCGGNSTSQPAARDAATNASCDYYARCGQIGAGKTYETRDSCEVQVRSFWEGQWPAADCDGKIKSSALDICLGAISSTLCNNGVDVLNTVLVKCAKADVCGGP
jgi:Family of unknown function (DUF6184)